MDGPLFDAMLKTALEEALRQDALEEGARQEGAPSRRGFHWGRKASLRHERRMVRLLSGTRRMGPARWAAALALAALLTGTAAGYALGGGGMFLRMFQESPWAAVYGGAADTEQLLDMGGRLDTMVVESDGLRLEMLDAVSDGQLAMVSVRLTVLEKVEALLEEPGRMSFRDYEIVPAGQEASVPAYGFSITSWPCEAGLEEGQYLLIFTINDAALAQGGQYEIHLEDFCAHRDGPALLPGAWTLSVTLRPGAVRTLYPNQTCEIGGAAWRLERLAVSPLALTMDFRCLEPLDHLALNILEDAAVRMADGRTITRADCTTGLSGSPEALNLTMEFQMPLDTAQVRSVFVCGQEIVLKECRESESSQ